MAYFIRTRRLDVGKLDKGPAENLEVVHAILQAGLSEVLQRVARLERQFYGPGGSALGQLRKWVGPIRNVMPLSGISQLGSLSTVEELVRQASLPERKFTVDSVHIGTLKECLRQCLDVVPHKFADVIRDCKAIMGYCERYCLSFYDPEKEPYLETAHTYEQQRKEYIKSVGENLNHIYRMAEMFRTTGLTVSDMSDYAVELARKAEAQSIVFLLMFPEACENIRTACKSIARWIDFDGNYAEFIANDIRDLEQKKTDAWKHARETEQKYHQLCFRQKVLQMSCDKLSTEFEKLKEREEELLIEEEDATSQTNDIQLEIETKEYRRDELFKNAAHIHPDVLYEKYSELSENLRDLKMRLPHARRLMNGARLKLDHIANKKEETLFEQKKLTEARQEVEEMEQSKFEREVEGENCVKALEIARKIHLYKSSPDAMEKIFHQRPVEINNNRLPGIANKDDTFERVCGAVACHIDNDWPKLYRALPFFPLRGTNTIDEDVRTFSNLESHSGLEHLARRCLHRWRRFHTRAKLLDLKQALVAIKRPDVLKVVDEIIDPPRPDQGPEDEIPTYVEEYLIPFVREVERFDKLRAANKI